MVNSWRAAIGVASLSASMVVATPPAHARAAVAPNLPPPLATFPTAFALSLLDPEANPPGANDWDCRPSRQHPEPVVLVHGTFANAYNAWAYMAPALKKEGYCVYAPNYGAERGNPVKGTGDIRLSARTLAKFVDRVLARSGAQQVALVGHSQGGMMPRWYLKYEGGTNPRNPARNKVSRLISLAATHHGTTVSGVMSILDILGLRKEAGAVLSKAAIQQATGSEFLLQLNRGGDTMPGVHYTALGTKFDEVATPYKQTFLSAGPGATVHNILLQDGCAVDATDHMAITYDPRALGFVKNALETRGPGASGTQDAPCQPFAPVVGPPLTDAATRLQARRAVDSPAR